MDRMLQQHAKEMDEFRKQNEERIAEHKGNIDQLKEELDKLKEEPFDPADPDRLVRKEKENFERFCELAREAAKDVPKFKKASLAVLGPSGVGKSSIINAFAGRTVAETDVIECTQEIGLVHATEKYDMYDVPGNRDERKDFYNIDNLLKFTALHLIMVVYTDRFEHVLSVTKLLKALDIPIVFVRNKCTFARNPEKFKKAYEKESGDAMKLAGEECPLIYLGFAEAEGDKPENTYQLMEVVERKLMEVKDVAQDS